MNLNAIITKPQVTKQNGETTTELSSTNSVDSKYKIVCNFGNQAWYRPGNRKYTPDHIDSKLCTHIVYNTAVLDPITLTIKMNDSSADIDNGFYKRVTDFKKKGIPVLLAIGGYGDAMDDKYSRLLSNASARMQFVADTVEFIQKYDFDGLEFHAEYPACWRTSCSSYAQRNEKHRLTDLMRELSEAFKSHGFLLSVFVSPLTSVIPLAYDAPELSK